MTRSPDRQQPPSSAPVRLDVRRWQAWRGTQRIRLSPKEFQLLHLLARHTDRVVTRDQIMREVWQRTGPVQMPATKTIDAHIANLRRRLHDAAADPQCIITVPGVGYLLARDAVEALDQTPAEQAALARIVPVKPGDTLLIGNVGPVSTPMAKAADALGDQLGLTRVVLFESDITLHAVPGCGTRAAGHGLGCRAGHGQPAGETAPADLPVDEP